MRAEAWVFILCTVFLVIVTPAYWFIAYEPTGTAALVMTTLLTALISFYLGFHARKMEPRPEDRKDAEIADGAGELGFFPPYSWWPMWCGLCLAVIVLGVIFAWWLFIIGAVFGVFALSGLIFEFYRGEHAH
jgi:hypothetical protein